jgi:hypothetical protein
VGDFTIAQAADAWTDFKRKQCAALSVVAVQRFRATFQAALNESSRQGGELRCAGIAKAIAA